MPGIYGITPTRVSGLKSIQFGAPSVFPSDASVKAAILSAIAKTKTAAGTNTKIADPGEFAAYNNHSPYELRVSAAAVKGGFYKQLTSLQGRGNTWWTGAAFNKHDSGDLWAFTRGLLDGIAAEWRASVVNAVTTYHNCRSIAVCGCRRKERPRGLR